MKRYIVALLWTNNLLIPCLTHPSTPIRRLKVSSPWPAVLTRNFPRNWWDLSWNEHDMEPPECLERILGLFKSMPDAASFRPLLTPLFRHPNARIVPRWRCWPGRATGIAPGLKDVCMEDDPGSAPTLSNRLGRQWPRISSLVPCGGIGRQ